MSNETKPPAPAAPAKPNGDPLDGYHAVADTVGFVPSLRWKDNLVQFAAAGAGFGLGAIAGLITHLIKKPSMPMWVLPAAMGVGGAIAATFISGFVIMILGFVRQGKRKQR
jgi:hypothetical protein